MPWPKAEVKGYELYPYHQGFDVNIKDLSQVSISEETEKIKINNYHLRPNLKFTDAYSHLMAQRLAWMMLKKPRYHDVAPLLLMEAVNCDESFVERELESKIAGYVAPQGLHLHTYMDPRSTTSRTKNLYAVSLFLGLQTADYNLHFNQAREPYYNTGAAGPHRHDTSIARMAQGVLMEEFSKKFPELKQYYRISRGVSEFFSPQDFSCIDDIAGQVYMEKIEDKHKLCAQLKSIYSGGKRTSALRVNAPRIEPLPRFTKDAGKLLLTNLMAQLPGRKGERVEPGRALLDACVGCHGSNSYLPPAYQFLSSEIRLQQEMKVHPDFIWRVTTYLESGRMPKGFPLSDDQVTQLQNYFFDLYKNALH